jgi:hypothetical protein
LKILRKGKENATSLKLANNAIFFARSKLSQFDSSNDLKKYLNNAQLFITKSFIEELEMKYKQHLPQYKSTLSKKRNWE